MTDYSIFALKPRVIGRGNSRPNTFELAPCGGGCAKNPKKKGRGAGKLGGGGSGTRETIWGGGNFFFFF